jgi:hypothetical protein
MIYDIEEIKKFQKLFLDNQGINESAIIYISARKKYDNSIKNIGLMNRTILTKDDEDLSDHLLNNINKEFYDDDGKIINKNALAIYMSINPRDTRTGAADLAKYIIDALLKNNTDLHLIPSKFRTIVQKSISKKLYTVLDVDTKNIYPDVINILNKYDIKPYCIIETRGGYHITLNHKDLGNLRYNTICECSKKVRCKHIMTFGEYLHKIMVTWKNDDDPNKAAVECAKDPYSPIPGTLQGGFPVKFINN